MNKTRNHPNIVVIGGGPAGLMAAGTASIAGARVALFEKNSNCGKKLLITGSGKCNITNSASKEDFLEQFAENRKFLYPAFKAFFRDDLENFFKRWNISFITEENGKVFPSTQSAATVLSALLSYCDESHVEIRYGEPVVAIKYSNEISQWVVKTSSGDCFADAVILATGGLSYPKTGSSGDGYEFSKANGHTVIPTRPALVPLETSDLWTSTLSGTSVRDVSVSLWSVTGDRISSKIAEQQGDLLFTHFGLSGPAALFLSRWLPDCFEERSSTLNYQIRLDLLPSKSIENLESSLLHFFSETPSRQLRTILNKEFFIPLSLVSAIVVHCGFPEIITGQQITREKRKVVLAALKNLVFPLLRTRGYSEAMVTAGGINTREIDPRTMKSRVVPGLFFAGEIVDVDGYTGGYNLQAAFSTGFLAGMSASDYVAESKKTHPLSQSD